MSGNGVKRSACKSDGTVSHYHPIGAFAIWPISPMPHLIVNVFLARHLRPNNRKMDLPLAGLAVMDIEAGFQRDCLGELPKPKCAGNRPNERCDVTS